MRSLPDGSVIFQTGSNLEKSRFFKTEVKELNDKQHRAVNSDGLACLLLARIDPAYYWDILQYRNMNQHL